MQIQSEPFIKVGDSIGDKQHGKVFEGDKDVLKFELRTKISFIILKIFTEITGQPFCCETWPWSRINRVFLHSRLPMVLSKMITPPSALRGLLNTMTVSETYTVRRLYRRITASTLAFFAIQLCAQNFFEEPINCIAPITSDYGKLKNNLHLGRSSVGTPSLPSLAVAWSSRNSCFLFQSTCGGSKEKKLETICKVSTLILSPAEWTQQRKADTFVPLFVACELLNPGERLRGTYLFGNFGTTTSRCVLFAMNMNQMTRNVNVLSNLISDLPKITITFNSHHILLTFRRNV